MREILFRGIDEGTKEWVYGYYYESPAQFYKGKECYIFDDKTISKYSVIPETIGQYTGLCDKNGKKIFEGDIVTMPSYGGGKHKSVVYFNNGKFAVDGSNYSFKDIAPRNMEIIGNIHDNKLLKGGDE